MYFQYDTNGIPLGFASNGIQYFYLTNTMGDVLGITEANGNLIAQYLYDDWGKLVSIDTADAETSTAYREIAEANPLRYRGYYYDSETGYYYLQSRYYDPSICRFINADVPEIAKVSKDISNGVNIFAYCNNNPTNDSDPNGCFGFTLGVKIAIGALIGAACYILSWLFFKKFTKDKFSVWELLKNIAYGAVSGLLSGFKLSKIASFALDFSMNLVQSIGKGVSLLEVLITALVVSLVSSLLSFGTSKLFGHFKKFGVSSKKIAKYDNRMSSAWKKSIKKNNYKIVKDQIHTYFKRMKNTLNRYITINTFSTMFGHTFDNIKKIAKNRGVRI